MRSLHCIPIFRACTVLLSPHAHYAVSAADDDAEVAATFIFLGVACIKAAVEGRREIAALKPKTDPRATKMRGSECKIKYRRLRRRRRREKITQARDFLLLSLLDDALFILSLFFFFFLRPIAYVPSPRLNLQQRKISRGVLRREREREREGGNRKRKESIQELLFGEGGTVPRGRGGREIIHDVMTRIKRRGRKRKGGWAPQWARKGKGGNGRTWVGQSHE